MRSRKGGLSRPGGAASCHPSNRDANRGIKKKVAATEKREGAAAFHDIKERAEARWRGLRKDRPVIMVGTATCGRAAGALDVLKAFRDEISKRQLDCPVIEVGCMGHCYAEQIVVISKPGN